MALTLVCALGAAPALAQDQVPPGAAPEANDLSRGADMLSQGMGLILRGLMDELDPVAEGWVKLLEMLDDFTAYEMPEMLPNGDILIRRKVPLEPGEVDL